MWISFYSIVHYTNAIYILINQYFNFQEWFLITFQQWSWHSVCITPYMKCFPSERRLFSPLDPRVWVHEQNNALIHSFAVLFSPSRSPNAFIGKFQIYIHVCLVGLYNAAEIRAKQLTGLCPINGGNYRLRSSSWHNLSDLLIENKFYSYSRTPLGTGAIR